MTSELQSLLQVGRDAVQSALAYMLEHRHRSVIDKGDRDMATDVDVAVERLVRAHLARRTPRARFLGEEEGYAGVGEQTWVLDPVDGTANFLHGIPLYAVSLGLLRDRGAVLGVIGVPALGRCYWAAEGHGAWLNNQRISASTTSSLNAAIVAVGDYGTGPDGPVRNQADFALHRELAAQAQRVRMFGSAAIDLAWVADGTLDASITLGNNPWDTAAGVAIAREAGGIVIDIDGSPHTTDSHTTIAAAPGLADQLLTLLHSAAQGTAYSTLTDHLVTSEDAHADQP